MSDICNKCKQDRSEELDLVYTAYGWVCGECAEELVKCRNCQELVEEEELSFYNGEYMCEGCQDTIAKQDTENELRGWIQRRQI
jgi:hypothetical protein